jgi:Transposase and inactivated derivatives
MRLSDRVFFRPGCGWAADRDHNASLDILRGLEWEPPLEPLELRTLPADSGQGGVMRREALP